MLPIPLPTYETVGFAQNRKPRRSGAFACGPGRIRTCDLGIKSPLLYQLSYRPEGRANG
jgi:hypothetical protein